MTLREVITRLEAIAAVQGDDELVKVVVDDNEYGQWLEDVGRIGTVTALYDPDTERLELPDYPNNSRAVRVPFQVTVITGA